MKKIELVVGMLLFVFIGLNACQPQEDAVPEEPSVLRVGILPDEGADRLLKKNQPLFHYLSQEIGLPIEFVPSKSYTHLLSQIHSREIHLFYLGGITFIQAYKRDQVVPLAMRDVDARFTSFFLVSQDNPAENLKDLRDRTFAFGSKFSTSGHYMPRYYLEKHGILAEKFFKEVRYSGKHDTTALWIQNGEVESGAANSRIIKLMIQSGELKEDRVRVLWETPPYPDYVWAAHPSLSASLQSKIMDAFLNLNPGNPAHRDLLISQDAESFLPSDIGEFSRLIKIYKQTRIPQQVP